VLATVLPLAEFNRVFLLERLLIELRRLIAICPEQGFQTLCDEQPAIDDAAWTAWRMMAMEAMQPTKQQAA
jgi:hypothetical protein